MATKAHMGTLLVKRPGVHGLMSGLGGVLQDAHYREQDHSDDDNGQGHNADGDGERGPHG
jgi:hypothetical protein